MYIAHMNSKDSTESLEYIWYPFQYKPNIVKGLEKFDKF